MIPKPQTCCYCTYTTARNLRRCPVCHIPFGQAPHAQNYHIPDAKLDKLHEREAWDKKHGFKNGMEVWKDYDERLE